MGETIAGGNLMRSLLVASGIIIFFVLAMGSGLTLAAASSEPGMFLYPIKQTTQKFTGANGDTTVSQPPIIDVPQDDVSQQSPAAGGSTSPQDIQEEVAQEPEITETPDPDQAASTPVPTPVRVTDEIAVTAEPSQVPNADVPNAGMTITGGVDNPPAFEQLISGYGGHSPDNDASDNGRSNESPNDGQSNENNNDHSESSDDDDSDDDSERDH
jgi:hypothetical protein